LHQTQESESDDYDEITSTTEKLPELWPSYFGDKQTFSESEGNKSTTTPPPNKKVFTWPSFFFTTPSETPSTSTTLAETTTTLNSSAGQIEVLPEQSQEEFLSNSYINSQVQINTFPVLQGFQSLTNPANTYNEHFSGNGNSAYQNNFQNPISSGQTGYNNQFQNGGVNQNLQNEVQSYLQLQNSPQNLQPANQFNNNQIQPSTNQFAANNQYQVPNSNSFQIANNNNVVNPWIQQNAPINEYLPSRIVNNGNAGQSHHQHSPNQNSILQSQQNNNAASSPVGTQITADNVLLWPDSFIPSRIPYETTTPALLPNVPGQPINFFTTPSTKPPKKVFTWPSYFLKSTEPIPTLPWSLPEDPYYVTPSPDQIYSPPKKISSWSQFPSKPLTTPKPFRHAVSTLGTTPTSTKRSFSPFKIFTWPSFYFTSTAKSFPAPDDMKLVHNGHSPSGNSSEPPIVVPLNNNNDTASRDRVPANASPRPEPQKTAPIPLGNLNENSNKATSPMSVTTAHPTIPETDTPFQILEESIASTSGSLIPEKSNQTSNSTTTKPAKTTQKPKPVRKPGGLIGAIQHFALIVPDALRPGRNTTSILNKQSVNSILKIIGSVAFLNLSGVIDNSVTLGTSDPVRELVSGVTGLVLCNPVVKQLGGGRCARELQKGETLEHVLNY